MSAAVWKIKKEWAGSLEEENRRLKRELVAKDTDVLASGEHCLHSVKGFSISHATIPTRLEVQKKLGGDTTR